MENANGDGAIASVCWHEPQPKRRNARGLVELGPTGLLDVDLRNVPLDVDLEPENDDGLLPRGARGGRVFGLHALDQLRRDNLLTSRRVRRARRLCECRGRRGTTRGEHREQRRDERGSA